MGGWRASHMPESAWGGRAMNTQEIRNMSTVGRLRAMEALWDSLVDEEPEVSSPEWQRDNKRWMPVRLSSCRFER
jgi:hypothetical protein